MPDEAHIRFTEAEFDELDELAQMTMQVMQRLTSAWCEKHSMWADDSAFHEALMLVLGLTNAVTIDTYVTNDFVVEMADTLHSNLVGYLKRRLAAEGGPK
jgi:hypothetical protein